VSVSSYITPKSIASIIVFITISFVCIVLFGEIQRHEMSRPAAELYLEQAKPVTKREEPEQLIDIFSDEDISYHGYEMKRLTKTINDETYRNVEVSYAVLTKNDRSLLRFDDGVYFVLGNSTEFGLFELLGNGSQQFIVSQTVPRGDGRIKKRSKGG
jgi:hypothetical protein